MKTTEISLLLAFLEMLKNQNTAYGSPLPKDSCFKLMFDTSEDLKRAIDICFKEQNAGLEFKVLFYASTLVIKGS